MPKEPLTLAELAAALQAIGGFEPAPFVAVAVSGGPDSLALALLADRWARQHGGRAWALTVDHRLRPQSGDEARLVAEWLARRGIPHTILAWPGERPKSGIQAAARAARYRLLAGWCRAAGCLHLLTAHHREDEGETYLIRRRARSGEDGLAAMPAVRELAGCRLLRPLLAVPKDRLAALLAAEGQPFLCDPANRNPAFERSRLRLDDAALADPAALDGAVAAARRYARSRVERERTLATLLAEAVALHPAGFAALRPQPIAAAPAELAERLLGRVAAAVGGASYPPRRARAARLRAALAALPLRARTLGGCRFVPWRGRVLVLREPGLAAPPVRLDPGMSLIWDGRLRVTLPEAAARGIWVGHLGQGPKGSLDRGISPLPRLIHPVLPAAWDEAGLVAVPQLGYRRAGAASGPSFFWHPDNPLTHGGFSVV